MTDFYWDDFSDYDDETLIPINMTAQEMALVFSAVSVLTEVEAWDDSFNYYNDVVPLIETIQFILRNV